MTTQSSCWRERGYDPVYGARPVKRALQRELETPLARRIVAGDYPPRPLR